MKIRGSDSCEKVIFWGAGNFGKEVLRFWKLNQISPDFFCDSKEELWGKIIDGVKIISPQEMYTIQNVIVYITCHSFNEISEELMRQGFSKNVIIRADGVRAPEMLYTVSEQLPINFRFNEDLKQEKGYLMDLSGGMVLGGVERWVYSLSKTLKKMGEKGLYLVPDYAKNTVVDKTFPTVFIDSNRDVGRGYFIVSCMKYIASNPYNMIICNFPFEIFLSACILKKRKVRSLNIVAVVHSDEECYYRAFCVWSKYIDTCLVISKKVKQGLIAGGFPAEKIEELYWNVSCEEYLKRSYSLFQNEPLRIGYAGRLKRNPKRLDLILDVAEKLKRHKIDFILEVAGIGDYEDTMRIEMAKRDLTKNVKIKGLIEHENIPQFWKEQDIYLSCSDWEGHSISQSEAMAAGAVPIVTNTSGAEDDIQNGYNGYIVDLRDIDAIVRHVEYLNQNREVLPIMGKRCHDRIWERNQSIDEERYWKELLLKGTVLLAENGEKDGQSISNNARL